MSYAVITFSMYLIITNDIVGQLGWQTSYILQQLHSLWNIPLLLLILGRIRESRLPKNWQWFWAVVVGNIFAYVAMNYGMEVGEVAILSVVSCLTGGVTAVLAWFFLRERLVINQYVGIGIGILGLAGLSL